MAVTPADAAELLTLAASFDQRIRVGEANAYAWSDALHDLDPQECAAAIRSHYRDSDAFIMPAHVRQRVKAIRDTEHERRHSNRLRDELAIEASQHDPEASRRGYELARQALAKAAGWDSAKQEALDAQRASQGVPCPFCGAAVGSPCHNVGDTRRTSHPSRVEKALKAGSNA